MDFKDFASIRAVYPDIPRRMMGNMRKSANHEYWGVEIRTIWKTIQDNLPPLILDLNKVIDSENDQDDTKLIIVKVLLVYN